jgi:acetyl-CoA carboxylase carboxyl transferase subunit alpha
MADTILNFEKPIAELEKKIQELEEYSKSNNIDVNDEIDLLTKKLQDTMRGTYEALSPWERVQLARHPKRPYSMDYIQAIFEDFIELHGDRRFRDDAAIVGGFARFDGLAVMVIGTQKGREMKENVFRNFGWPSPEGYRKALRLMKIADKARVPIITFVDTPGAYPGVASEERHIAEAIAVNMRDMFALEVPVISVVIGEGGSGGAIGIGVGNRVLIMENAYYSVITPEGCAAILWKNRSYAEQAAQALCLTAVDLVRLKIADEVIPEPLGGAHKDHAEAAAAVKKVLQAHLNELSGLSVSELLDQRYQKFRQIAEFTEKEEEPGDDE